jgi:Tfp pilus assembly protein FimT
MEPDCRPEAGYTVIEMTLTLLLVSSLLAMGFGAAAEMTPRWRLRTASTDLAQSLRAARARAVVDRTPVTLAFDTKRDLYTRTVTGSADAPVVTRLPDTVTFARPDAGKIVTVAPPKSPTEAAAAFTSAGLLNSGITPGEVYLGVPRHGLYRRVRVSYVGTVEVQEWTGKTWR